MLIFLKPLVSPQSVKLVATSYFASSTRGGNMANIGDGNLSTYWMSFYDAGENVGFYFNPTNINKISVTVNHNRLTYLQIHNGTAWVTVTSIPAASGTFSYSYNYSTMYAKGVRVLSGAPDNVVTLTVFELTTFS